MCQKQVPARGLGRLWARARAAKCIGGERIVRRADSLSQKVKDTKNLMIKNETFRGTSRRANHDDDHSSIRSDPVRSDSEDAGRERLSQTIVLSVQSLANSSEPSEELPDELSEPDDMSLLLAATSRPPAPLANWFWRMRATFVCGR